MSRLVDILKPLPWKTIRDVIAAIAAIVAIFTFISDQRGWINIIPHNPSIRVSRLSYSLNGTPPQMVFHEDTIEVNAGDTIRLLDLWYHSPKDGDKEFDKAAGEAYIRDPNGTFRYGDGRFTNGVLITSGGDKIDDLYGEGAPDEWTLQEGMDKVIVELIHYRKCWHPEGCHEVDDRFCFNLRYRRP